MFVNIWAFPATKKTRCFLPSWKDELRSKYQTCVLINFSPIAVSSIIHVMTSSSISFHTCVHKSFSYLWSTSCTANKIMLLDPFFFLFSYPWSAGCSDSSHDFTEQLPLASFSDKTCKRRNSSDIISFNPLCMSLEYYGSSGSITIESDCCWGEYSSGINFRKTRG